jgi:hypothetical protein
MSTCGRFNVVSERTEYHFKVNINGRCLSHIVIDQHYAEKHVEMNDELILELVKTLDGGNFVIENVKDGFEYFTVEPVIHEDNPYRLVLVICIFDDFLGVVNAFRVRRKKDE